MTPKMLYCRYSKGRENNTMKNNTFDKAKEPKSNKKRWYVINGKKYSYYVWAMPLVPFVTLYDVMSQQADKRRVWSAERATKDKAYYYCMDWGTSNLWRGAKRTDRKWAQKWQYQLRDFIKEGYENEHYSKSVEKDYYDTWIKFEERV